MTTDTKGKRGLRLFGTRRRHSPWFYIVEVLIWAFLAAMVVIEIAPISWLFSTSLRDPTRAFDLPPNFLPTEFKWENYLAVILL